jgi:protein-tyrosine phosphatase
MNILFVCSGNISRSFLAERLFNEAIKRLGRDDFRAASAGLYVYPDNPPDPKMVAYLEEKGIPARGHGARPVVKEYLEGADLILVMEHDHLRFIERKWPEIREKVHHLGAFLSPGHRPDDIIDPFGASPYHYRLAQAQITLAVNALIDKIAAVPANEPS